MSRTVLVTGGTGGLGAAVTSAFLDAGWHVVVPWIVEAELGRVPEHPNLELVRADLFDADSARECVDRAAAGPDPLRAVVNLVGGFAMGGRVHETPVEDFERQLRLNLRPTYLTCHAAIPHLIDADGGAIVLALVDALDTEYGRDGIRVNAVLPGTIDTPANRASMPDADRADWVAPARIAEVIRYLCEDGSATISGARVPVHRSPK